VARSRLRVVAGEAGGRRLVAPPGVRPTSERAREALFDALGDAVVDAHVLDLYAGSGALAIEALSRRAAVAVLVDSDRAAVAACRRNLESTGLRARARLHAAGVERFVAAAPPVEAPFDLVVCDPPYEHAGDLAGVLAALRAPGWLAPAARVVLETDARAEVSPPPGYDVRSRRRYGDTLLTTVGPVPLDRDA
jgi:16S rRNA (guanine966-N2)-methyltransferase